MKKVLILSLIFTSLIFSQVLQESFSGPVFPPEGWSVYNLEDSTAPRDKSVWQQDGRGPHTEPGCAFCPKSYAGGNSNPTGPNDDWLVTPRLYPSEAAYNLTFYYRGYTPNQKESLEVWVSRAGNTPNDFKNPATGYRVDALAIYTWDYTMRVVSLSSFINQPVYVAFRYCSNNPNRHGVFIDDVNTDSIPYYPPIYRVPLDVGVIEIKQPEAIITPTPFTPRATVKNYGPNPATFETKCFIYNQAGTATYYTKNVVVTALPYNQIVDVSFPETTLAAGFYKIKFKTYLAGDQNPLNDEMIRDFQVLNPTYHDVGVTTIFKPVNEISEPTVLPKIEVRNFGSQTENFRVRIEIKNTNNHTTVYFDTAWITLPPLVNSELEFTKIWTPTPTLYSYEVKAFTQLSNDNNRANDTCSAIALAPLYDAKVTTIFTPLYPVYEPTQEITPSAQISNRSFTLDPVNIPSTFSIIKVNGNQVYSHSVSTTINFCDDATVEYNPWVAETGYYVVKCKVNLTGDNNRSNDSIIKDLFIPFRDVKPRKIVVPADNFVKQSIVPRAIIDNNSNYYINAPIEMTIRRGNSTVVCDTNYVTIFENSSGMVYFPAWMPDTGWYNITFRQIFPYDLVPSNDIISKNFYVQNPTIDLEIVQIKAPKDTIAMGRQPYPRVIVRNIGDAPVTGPVITTIENQSTRTLIYIDTVLITTPLLPNTERILTFDQCNSLNNVGNYELVSIAEIEGDINTANNTKTLDFVVSGSANRDVGVSLIAEPKGCKPLGLISSMVIVRNYGSTFENFGVQLKIYRRNQILPLFAPIVNVELAPQQTEFVFFPQWASDLGDFIVRCTTLLEGDVNVSNNYKDTLLSIRQDIRYGWDNLTSLPSAQNVKDGGALTIIPNKGIYAFVGNKTNIFKHYNPETNTWTDKAPIPNNIFAGSGAALCNDGDNRIYAIFGNNTRYFYTYVIDEDVWLPLDQVPGADPTKPKRIKGGAGLAYIKTDNGDYVYLVKGNNTNEFWAYSVSEQTWQRKPDIDLGPTGREKVKDGSAITTDGQYFIYLLKAKYNYLYIYDISTGNWIRRAAVEGKPVHKDVSKGSTIAYCLEGTAGTPTIYALKGGSFEFWRYNIMRDGWTYRSAMNMLTGSSGKKVGAGASLVYDESKKIFYALKGNKTTEFYKYVPDPNLLNNEERLNVQIVTSEMTENITNLPYLKVHPKLINNNAYIYYQVKTLKPITIKLYNNVGVLVRNVEHPLNTQNGVIAVDVSDIANGVYFVKVESADNKILEKIVVQK
ncbi:MAG: choice-of-anchor J domain-containing protein [candidate division WOR-3 bacterium]